MDRCIIDDHHRFLGDRLAKPIKTSGDDFGRHRVVHAERGQLIIRSEKPQDIEAFALGGRDFDRFPDFLPSIRKARIQ